MMIAVLLVCAAVGLWGLLGHIREEERIERILRYLALEEAHRRVVASLDKWEPESPRLQGAPRAEARFYGGYQTHFEGETDAEIIEELIHETHR